MATWLPSSILLEFVLLEVVLVPVGLSRVFFQLHHHVVLHVNDLGSLLGFLSIFSDGLADLRGFQLRRVVNSSRGCSLLGFF